MYLRIRHQLTLCSSGKKKKKVSGYICISVSAVVLGWTPQAAPRSPVSVELVVSLMSFWFRCSVTVLSPPRLLHFSLPFLFVHVTDIFQPTRGKISNGYVRAGSSLLSFTGSSGAVN